jgi:DNA topoisomerase-1
MKGLSAGRVQSVAVRLIAEREEEIKNFVPQEFWQIIALLKKKQSEFKANLIKKDGKSIDELEIKEKKSADKILNAR